MSDAGKRSGGADDGGERRVRDYLDCDADGETAANKNRGGNPKCPSFDICGSSKTGTKTRQGVQAA